MARVILVRFDLSGMLTVCIGVTLLPIGYTDAIAAPVNEKRPGELLRAVCVGWASTRANSVIVPHWT